jgi:5,6-dimethylbenzimidazole synthase
MAMTPQYEMLIDVLRRRMSVRKLKSDPIPEGAIEKILEAGRWAISGANAQPWEYIVITDSAKKRALFNLYKDQIDDYNFWMEQMRVPELRHPAFQLTGSTDEQLRKLKARPGWSEAPALIVVVGDGRRQWATVVGGHTFGRHQSHFTDGLAITCILMHLAAASMGLGTQWVTIHIEEGFKRMLNIPDIMTIYTIIPVGYPDVPPKKGVRRPLENIVHYNQYDLSKHMSNQQIINYIYELRNMTMAKYIKASEKKDDVHRG